MFAYLIKPIFIKNQRKLFKFESDFQNETFKFLKASETIKQIAKTSFLKAKIDNENKKLYSQFKKVGLWKSFNSSLTTIFFAISQIGLIVLATYLMQRNLLKNTNSLSSIIYISGLLSVPMVRIEKLFFYRVDFLTAKLKISKIFANSNDIARTDRINLASLNSLTFIDFKYDLKNVHISIPKFEISKGDRVKISGKSGSGKTTLLRLLMNEDQSYQGKVLVNDELTLHDAAPKITYISQNESLLPVSLLQNITLSNENTENEKEKVRQIISEVGLAHKTNDLNQSIETFSLGEQKRVEIARALYFDAQLYIFDEAFTGIDFATKNAIIEIIKEKIKDKIFIFVTHDNNLNLHNKEICVSE
ncbi:ATP-binding cassette domain-containing protein [Mycoplasmopsis columbinasalis]|nr:ABC transporter ATP-binding protein [Mycoplasmopsis columbinasalis]